MTEQTIYVGHGLHCDYSTIGAALAGLEGEHFVTIYVEAGEYREYLAIYRSHVRLIGLGRVLIIGSRSAEQIDETGRKLGTFRTATVLVNASEVTLENISIINDAGPGEEVSQAIALYSFGQNITVRNCALYGHQDTLCLGPLPRNDKYQKPMPLDGIREVYSRCTARFEGCYIAGTVDFIFGGGYAIFNGCQVHSLYRKNGQEGYITAASTDSAQAAGLVFTYCLLTADEGAMNIYLGRPWRPYGHTKFFRCRMGAHIHPLGWDNWQNTDNEKTARFEEVGNIYAGEVRRPQWVRLERE